MIDRGVARRGTMFPDFVLPTPDGALVQLESYRGQKNLVVVFTGDSLDSGFVTRLLQDLVARKDELASEAAQVFVIAISQPPPARVERQWTFPILVDHEGRLHGRVGATAAGRPSPGVFVTDRFREIYATYLLADATGLPSAKEVMDWIAFINIQCPECGVPEWPAQ